MVELSGQHFLAHFRIGLCVFMKINSNRLFICEWTRDETQFSKTEIDCESEGDNRDGKVREKQGSNVHWMSSEMNFCLLMRYFLCLSHCLHYYLIAYYIYGIISVSQSDKNKIQLFTKSYSSKQIGLTFKLNVWNSSWFVLDFAPFFPRAINAIDKRNYAKWCTKIANMLISIQQTQHLLRKWSLTSRSQTHEAVYKILFFFSRFSHQGWENEKTV